jgi:hypothetical protein
VSDPQQLNNKDRRAASPCTVGVSVPIPAFTVLPNTQVLRTGKQQT